jgi:polyisoprenoid-binding protein YceI
MKQLFIPFLLVLSFSVSGQVMQMSDETSDVSFETKRNLGKLEGTVRGINGTAFLDTNNLAASYINLSVSTKTLLHNDRFTGPDFTAEDCFNVKKFPYISLRSASITKLKGENQYQFNGGLIVKTHTAKVSFPFTAVPNIGGYDFLFEFPLVKKDLKIDCGFRKKMMFKVRAYGKKKFDASQANG